MWSSTPGLYAGLEQFWFQFLVPTKWFPLTVGTFLGLFLYLREVFKALFTLEGHSRGC